LYNTIIIGGGAAGFFSAINVKENFPNSKVYIYEKSGTLLAKVKISGGGRCNVTNGCESISELAKAYPRGAVYLKKAFKQFNNTDAFNWFQSRGVELLTQDDNCVFPKSQDSQSIIDCFLHEAKKLDIKIRTNCAVKYLHPKDNTIDIEFADESIKNESFSKVIVTTGGSPQKKGLNWLEYLGHKIEHPVPSLFTFNISKHPVNKLMGIVVENALVNIQNTKLKSDGPLLIAHWGMSGPAILKLSSLGARILNEKDYNFNIQVNWVAQSNENLVQIYLNDIVDKNPQKILANFRPYNLSERLWFYLLEKINMPQDKKWQDLGKKGINKLSTILTNDVYPVNGKSTFREEFVTCGGVSLQSVDINTMQSKVCNNVYFAGEVLDIDAITGGFNFQAAWTTGFIAGKLG
jgi:predicted Rossmann fold flavoprotein